MFGIGKIPSGEKDPFGLRRAANGIIHIILAKKLTLNLRELIDQAYLNYAEALKTNNETVSNNVLTFIYERLRYIYSEQGKSANIFRDVLACSPEDLLDFTNRFDAVTEFYKSEHAADLIEIYKRIKNILNKANIDNLTNLDLQPELLHDPSEQKLAAYISTQSAKIHALHQEKNYLDVLLLLAQAKPVLSEFFTNVMVMVEDENIKTNRLVLLNKLKQLFNLVADFNS
jgi:glycyl-tRNA synthetase beta chain